MKKLALLFFGLMGVMNMAIANETYNKNNSGMIVRISKVEVYPEHFDDYLAFAANVAEASVEKEEGVISIFPMMQIRDKYQIRILEIYKNEDAYKKHIASEHFQIYKQGTLHMVKSLDLVDMYQITPKVFDKVFKKSKN